jgi:transcriptional regulator with XRE-family HTH domain
MNQNELGIRIAQQRKRKGMTQVELANDCFITTRSLQRIEAGQALPRSFTLKKISDALESNFEDLENLSNSTNANLQEETNEVSRFPASKTLRSIIALAIISGLTNIVVAIGEVVISYIQYKHYTPSNAVSLMSVFVYFASFITCIIYLYGLFIVGKLNRNIFLIAGTILFMFVMVLVKGDDVISASNSFLKSYLNMDARFIMFGSAILLNGTGILLLRKKYGLTATIAGILDCLNGLVFLWRLPFPVGLITLAIARIAESCWMYQIYIKINKNSHV